MDTQLRPPNQPTQALQLISLGTRSTGAAVAPSLQTLTHSVFRSVTTAVTCCSSRCAFIFLYNPSLAVFLFNCLLHKTTHTNTLTHSHPLSVQIWDPTTDRYEVPVPLSVPAAPETDETKRLYKVTVTKSPFGIQVIRKSTGTTMCVFHIQN